MKGCSLCQGLEACRLTPPDSSALYASSSGHQTDTKLTGLILHATLWVHVLWNSRGVQQAHAGRRNLVLTAVERCAVLRCSCSLVLLMVCVVGSGTLVHAYRFL